MSSLRDQIADLPQRISDRLAEAWPDLRDDPVYLDQLGEEAAKVVQPGDFRDFCGASAVGVFRQVLGPCILRHGHDGPVHEDAQRQQWTHSIIPTGEHDDLRDQIEPTVFSRLGQNTATERLIDDLSAVVQPELDAKDAQIERLTEERDAARMVSQGRTMEEYDQEDLKQRTERLAIDLTAMQTIATERSEACGRAEAERDKVQADLEAYTTDVLSVLAKKNTALERAAAALDQARTVHAALGHDHLGPNLSCAMCAALNRQEPQ